MKTCHYIKPQTERTLLRTVQVAMLYAMLLMVTGSLVWGLTTPLLGDDLLYARRAMDVSSSSLPLLRHSWSVWLHTNARTGDMLNYLWLYTLPRPLTLLLLCAGVYATLWGILRLGRISWRTPLCGALTLLASLWLLPWGDMGLYVCHFNYVWGTALMLPILVCLLYRPLHSRWWIALTPVVAIATATHEALGMPLAAGMALYWWCRRTTLRGQLHGARLWWVVAIGVGALFSISSPASYRRAAAGNPPDLQLWSMLIQVIPLVCLLIVRIIWLWARGGLRTLMHSSWVIVATAAICSSAYTLVGGIAGRGGWYAEVFAIIALAIDLGRYERRRPMSRVRLYTAVAVALGSCGVAVYRGVEMAEDAARRYEAVLIYQSTYGSPLAQQYIRDELGIDPWEIATLPLTIDAPVHSGDYYYEPERHLSADDPDPTDPIL